MAFPTGWGRRCALTIQATEVDADLTDWTYILTEDSLPSEMFDADGSSPALNGGGDIRFSSDEAGATQLACDVRLFTTDNDPANGTADIAVKVPSVSSSTNTTIYVWYNKAGESQPAVSDTYGRYNAYDSNMSVWWGNATITRTTPLRTLTLVGNASVNNLDGSRPYFNFDGTDDGMRVAAWLTAAPIVFHGLLYQATSVSAGIHVWNGDSNFGSWSAFYASVAGTEEIGAGIVQPTNDFQSALSSPHTMSADTWTYFAARFASSTSRFAYVNDNVGTEVTTSCIPTGVDLFHLGGSRNFADGSITNEYNGRLSELRVSGVDRSSAWLNAEYSNLLTPATFTTVGTPGSTSYTLTAESGSYAVTGTAASLEFGRSVSAESGSYSISGTAATLKFSRVLPAESGSYLISGTAAGLKFGRVIAIAGGSYSISGTEVSLRYSGSNPSIEAFTGGYALSGTAAGLLLNRVLSAESGSYSLSGTDVGLKLGRVIAIGSGSYSLSGTDVGLKLGRVIVAESGSYLLTGTAATLSFSGAAGLILTAEAGAYAITGTDVDLRSLSVYYAILKKVKEDIQGLVLTDIASGNIQIVKVLNERETIIPGLPGILIVPMGQELMPSGRGTSEKDYIGYPVAVVMLDIDRQDTGSGEPEDADPGTQDQDFRFDAKLQWREWIVEQFSHKRLTIPVYGADVYTCHVEPSTIVQANTWLQTNLWVSTLVLRFWSRETRG